MVDLREYETGFVPSVRLTRSDKLLIRTLEQEKTRRLKVTEMGGGVEVKASHWVGVVQFEEFQVRVRPKLIGGEHVLMAVLDYASDSSAFRRYAAKRSFEPDTESLLEIFIRLFVEDCERLVRLGLLTDYVEREDALAAVRGRILFDRQVLERFGQVDRVLCRFDEREHDIIENRLLGYALERCQSLTRDLSTRRRVRRLTRTFELHCGTSPCDLEEARRSIVYSRLNDHYQPAHQLAWAIIDALGIDDYFDSVSRQHHAFLLNMNTLFERFVERFVSDALAGSAASVKKQFSDSNIIRGVDGSTHRSIRPDVLVKFPQNAIPIDAKYKLYDEKSISTADIYQLHFYGRAYHRGAPRGLLIYPGRRGSIDEFEIRDSVGEPMGRFAAFGVDLRSFFDERAVELDRLRNALDRMRT